MACTSNRRGVWTAHFAVPSSTGLPGNHRIHASTGPEDRLAFEQATRELDEIVKPDALRTARARTDEDDNRRYRRDLRYFGACRPRYLRLLQGADLVSVEPVPQYDTMAPFMFPWHPEAYAEWAKTQEP